MAERLTVSGATTQRDIDRLLEVSNCNQFGRNGAYYKLQHYEDLEEQGRLIELPCKVGDTVYYITGIHNTLIKPAKVEEVYFGDVFAVHVSTQNTSFTLVEGEFFLTKEEAEAALKGAENDVNTRW